MASLTVSLPPPAVAAATDADGYQNAADAAVTLLRGNRSLWPVDTGRSKRAWRRIGSGYSSEIFNPLRYASYVEALNRQPAETTLARNVARLVEAARQPSMFAAPEGTRAGILEAFLRRAALETAEDVYGQYAQLRRVTGRRAPRIPAAFRAQDRRIRRLATR